MSERPILMSAPMVLAILAGTKTETRRPVRWRPSSPADVSATRQPDEVAPYTHIPGAWLGSWHEPTGTSRSPTPSPYGVPGDRLWVRERTRVLGTYMDLAGREGDRLIDVRYEADGWGRRAPHPARLRPVQPGRCMPMGCTRESSRILLRVEEVRVERLRAIDEAGAIAEGVDPSTAEMASRAYGGPHRRTLARLWGSIYGHRPGLAWADDPWVWVVRYTVLDTMGGL